MKDFAGGIGKVQIKEHPRGFSGLFVEVPGIWLPAEQRLPRVEIEEEEEEDADGLPVLMRAHTVSPADNALWGRNGNGDQNRAYRSQSLSVY